MTKTINITLAALMLLVPLMFAGAAQALSVSCTGAPSASSITWSGSASNGVPPYALLWENGATTSPLTVAAVAGTHTIALQATDASSTVATTTCSATVAAPAATSTPSSTFSQIQALLAQIEGLKKQIAQLLVSHATGGNTGTGTTTPMGCFGFWRDLKRGDQGDDVRELQRELAKSDPKLFPPGLVNGFFGPKTFAALKMFQKRFGIDVNGTGFFGQKSRGHFAAQCSRGDRDGDGLKKERDDDNSGRGNNSGKGKSDDNHDNDHDNSGPGSGDDDDNEDEDDD